MTGENPAANFDFELSGIPWQLAFLIFYPLIPIVFLK
jgi:hypothetical protein